MTLATRNGHDRRLLREAPYLAENLASKARVMRPPQGLPELLAWFLGGWAAETPERIHSAGVWRARMPRVDVQGRPVEEVPKAHVGGSLLGSPREAEPFRQHIENSARQTGTTPPADYSGTEVEFYVRPMRAALARMASSRRENSALLARFLEQVALNAERDRLREAVQRYIVAMTRGDLDAADKHYAAMMATLAPGTPVDVE